MAATASSEGSSTIGPATTVWRVAGTVHEVMAVLGDAESLPRWWPSVYLSVVPVKDAAPDGTGLVVDLHTKGWLPYTLRWALTITESTARTALATGVLRSTPEVVKLLGQNNLPKGGACVCDGTDRRLHGAKRTLSWCRCATRSRSPGHRRSRGRRCGGAGFPPPRAPPIGPEWNGIGALTAVVVAGLTPHDRIKAIDPAAVLDAVRVETMNGGKTSWTRPADR